MARAVLEAAVGLPAGACRLLCALSLLDAQGEVATRDKLARLLAVAPESVSRLMRDLVRANIITREAATGGHAQGVEYTWKINHNDKPVIRRRADGKVARCNHCNVLNPLGKYCEKCKQRFRTDRAWHDDAIAIADELGGGKPLSSPYKVQAELVRRGYDSVPLWDKQLGSNERRASGLVSVLLEAGKLSRRWEGAQRNALDGQSEEW